MKKLIAIVLTAVCAFGVISGAVADDKKPAAKKTTAKKAVKKTVAKKAAKKAETKKAAAKTEAPKK